MRHYTEILENNEILSYTKRLITLDIFMLVGKNSVAEQLTQLTTQQQVIASSFAVCCFFASFSTNKEYFICFNYYLLIVLCVLNIFLKSILITI